MNLPFFKDKDDKAVKTSGSKESIPALINLVLTDFIATNGLKLGKSSLNSVLTRYNTEDFTSLNDSQKQEFLGLLYEKYKDLFGFDTASQDLEKSVKSVVSRFGVSKGYLELLEILPSGVLESEKVSTLGRDELENVVRDKTKLLEQTRSELEKRINERTSELDAERNRFRMVLYNVVDGVFALDKQKRVIAFNKSIEDMTGFLEAQVLGNSVDDFVKFFDREGSQLTSDIYSPTIKLIEDKSVYKAENVILKGRNNKEFHVNLVSSVINEGSGTNVGCIVTVHDITSQRELETMKLDFVSIAAHELRTPLTAIRGYLSLLISENEAANILNEDQRAYLERAYLSSNQLFSLVENLLNVARIERGSVVVDKSEVEWAPLVSQIVQSFNSLAAERKVKLTFMPIDTSTKVMVDAIMIGEVISNLLDNAIRYTHSGGSVLVFLEATDKFIITHIKDDGQGIPQESVQHLFNKFYRVSGVLEQGSKGTGLGLYISKEIVKLHGGDIWVESELGKGSVFSFSVPRVTIG